MLKIPYFKQDTRYSCGPATLQMIFAFYGKEISETNLTERLKTKEGDGTKHSNLIRVANEEGFYVYVNTDSSIEEVREILAKDIPVIVNFVEPSNEEGHYAVVVDITGEKIFLNDPWNGENFEMSIIDFENRWQSGDGLHKEWLMAVSDKDFSLGKQYLP